MLEYNFNEQIIYGITLKLMKRSDYKYKNSKRFTIVGKGNNKQNIWIPNKFLKEDGTIIGNLVWLFRKWETKHKIMLSSQKI